MVWVRQIRDYFLRIRILLFFSTFMLSISVITRPYVRKFLPVVTATAPYFYGSILLRAIKYKKIVVLAYVHLNNVNLIIMWKFSFEDVQF
jgi:hypothetical protein